jgi:hypothetical protein
MARQGGPVDIVPPWSERFGVLGPIVLVPSVDLGARELGEDRRGLQAGERTTGTRGQVTSENVDSDVRRGMLDGRTATNDPG